MRPPIQFISLLLLVSPVCLPAQDTRAELIQQQRQEKAAKLQPESPDKPEKTLLWIKDNKILERISAGYNGLRVKIGGLATGSGMAFGPEYLRADLYDGRMSFRAAAQTSIRGYQLYETEWAVPRIAADRAFASLRAAHRNYSGIEYYGPGPDSHKNGRSNYRLEDTAADGVFGVRPVRGVTLGASAGHLWMNVGPGNEKRFVSADRIYQPGQAPGIDRQTNFLRYGVFGEFSWLDDPAGPKHGGRYFAQYIRYNDRELSTFSFNRLEIDLQQYIGLFNKRRVLAFRARSVLTDRDRGNQVPFYLQPVLGGSDDLRGFRPFRFSDNNSLVFNGEYRWEVFTGLDMALFGDAGKVFPKRGQLNFRDLEASAGFGFRFNVRNRTFMRLDVGFSHEGFQVWFKFSDVFGPRLPGTAYSQPVP